ncbi:MAG: hypothetical protein IH895_06110, partial [Planctomycetes bacterium]|nr:hypothetical protein [Planctomycetota bacterium]
GTVFAFGMSGEAAETFTQESDGTMTYALSVNLVERDETGATLDRSMAVQCAVVLERK